MNFCVALICGNQDDILIYDCQKIKNKLNLQENPWVMAKYKDYKAKKRVVEVHDLSFLSDRNHSYGWIRRHYRHHKLRRALKKAEKIIASNPKVASDIVRYYFVPKEKITLK